MVYIIFFRCNGNDVASFYDQNHDSNHRSSMVGQSVLLNLKIGDVIQVSIKNLLVEVSYFSDRNFDWKSWRISWSKIDIIRLNYDYWRILVIKKSRWPKNCSRILQELRSEFWSEKQTALLFLSTVYPQIVSSENFEIAQNSAKVQTFWEADKS